MRTIFADEISTSGASDTAQTQKTAETEPEPMKYPVKVKHRGHVLATIYGKSKSYPLYRVSWSVSGQRRMKAFPTYSEAKRHADKMVKELAKGSQVTLLTTGQANDALAAFERLHAYYLATGIKVSLLSAASQLVERAAKLNGHTFDEVVEGFFRTAVLVSRKNLAEAVNDFVTAEELRTKAAEGKRAQLSVKYHYNRAIMLRRFASTFPNSAVCDLTRADLDLFFTSLGEIKTKSRNGRRATSAKSRNHHRAAIGQFLQWAIRKDYLATNHRLGEADGMRPENGNTSEIEFYTPAEFKTLLDTAEGPMRAMIAIGGFAGLRTAELLRLTWEDTRRVDGHIEITSGKAKTRQRRLVEIVPALAKWLTEFKESEGKIWTGHEITWQQQFCKVCEQAKHEIKPGQTMAVKRKPNGLRHAFCTYHLAAHGNENLTALQAGNSPAMLFAHYRGLAKKNEAEAWFAVAPK